jgi:flagellar biosynthesis protein FlhG
VRGLGDQDHYEVLEVHRGAAPEDIERAYRTVRETYRPESLALYSVFGDRDASVIRERIEEAYRILSDAEARRAYDAATADDAAFDAPVRAGSEAAEGSLLRHIEAERLEGASESFRELESEVDDDTGEFDGARLRRARLRSGFELQQVSDITKVSVANLTRIEEEQFDELPATVYVRGFVIAYARTIGLDADRVLAGYMARVERARAEQGRSRFRSRA